MIDYMWQGKCVAIIITKDTTANPYFLELALNELSYLCIISRASFRQWIISKVDFSHFYLRMKKHNHFYTVLPVYLDNSN